jgi:hypothetical protein
VVDDWNDRARVRIDIAKGEVSVELAAGTTSGSPNSSFAFGMWADRRTFALEMWVMRDGSRPEVPPPTTDAPAGAPVPRKVFSEDKVRKAIEDVANGDSPPSQDAEELRKLVEEQLGMEIPRDPFLELLPARLKLPVGRPRKRQKTRQ